MSKVKIPTNIKSLSITRDALYKPAKVTKGDEIDDPRAFDGKVINIFEKFSKQSVPKVKALMTSVFENRTNALGKPEDFGYDFSCVAEDFEIISFSEVFNADKLLEQLRKFEVEDKIEIAGKEITIRFCAHHCYLNVVKGKLTAHVNYRLKTI